MRYREIIEEGRDAYLFHGTALFNAIGILEDNCIEMSGDYAAAEWQEGVGTSRDFRTARSFGAMFERRYPVVFVLDQARLAHRFRIRPYRDKSGWDDEYRPKEQEETVIGPIKPLNRYLISINIDKAKLQAAIKNKNWVEGIAEEWEVDPKWLVAGAKALLKHPLLNKWKPHVAMNPGDEDGNW